MKNWLLIGLAGMLVVSLGGVVSCGQQAEVPPVEGEVAAPAAETAVTTPEETKKEQPGVEAHGKIAFVSGYSNINVIDADGSSEKRLVEGRIPIWSPYGKRIAYSDKEGNLSVINVDGTNSIRIAEKAGNPIQYYSWSPDEQRLVYVVEEDIEHVDIDSLWIVDSDGSNPIKIAEGNFACRPSLSPDGRQLAVIMGSKRVFDPKTGWSSTEYSLYTMNLDGTNKVKLAEISEPLSGWAVSWSPSGNKIAYSAFALIVIDSDGTNEIVIDYVTYTHLAWAPDGRRIAYGSSDGELITVNLDGTGKKKLAQGKYVTSFSWSPDGYWLTFQKEEQIFIVNIDGTGLTQLAYGRSPQWSPAP